MRLLTAIMLVYLFFYSRLLDNANFNYLNQLLKHKLPGMQKYLVFIRSAICFPQHYAAARRL